MKEIWIDVVGYEGRYQVSNLGNIYSLLYNRLMTPQINKDGYPVISMRKNNRRFGTGIYRLVAIAFIPNPNNYSEVNHVDGNKLNCCVDNLEWCNHSMNQKHAYDKKLRVSSKGEKNGNSKLTENDVREIKKLKGKMSGLKVCKLYGVENDMIYKIWNGHHWKHLV